MDVEERVEAEEEKGKEEVEEVVGKGDEVGGEGEPAGEAEDEIHVAKEEENEKEEENKKEEEREVKKASLSSGGPAGLPSLPPQRPRATASAAAPAATATATATGDGDGGGDGGVGGGGPLAAAAAAGPMQPVKKGRMNLVTHRAQLDVVEEAAAGGLVMIYCSASWCVPCRTMTPIVNELARRPVYKSVQFVTLDTTLGKELTKELNVQRIPTFQFYRRGVLLHQFSGGNKKKIVLALDRYKREVTREQAVKSALLAAGGLLASVVGIFVAKRMGALDVFVGGPGKFDVQETEYALDADQSGVGKDQVRLIRGKKLMSRTVWDKEVARLADEARKAPTKR